MLTFLLILVIAASILMVVIILAQNPKGGGLSPSFSGLNTQIVGARQTADFLEKATWYLAIGIIVVVMFSNVFIPADGERVRETPMIDEHIDLMPFSPGAQQQQQPQQQPEE